MIPYTTYSFSLFLYFLSSCMSWILLPPCSEQVLSNNGQSLHLFLGNPTLQNTVTNRNCLNVIFITCSGRKLLETPQPRMGPGGERDVVGLSEFPVQLWYRAEIRREKNSPPPPLTPRGTSDFQCAPVWNELQNSQAIVISNLKSCTICCNGVMREVHTFSTRHQLSDRPSDTCEIKWHKLIKP